MCKKLLSDKTSVLYGGVFYLLGDLKLDKKAKIRLAETGAYLYKGKLLELV